MTKAGFVISIVSLVIAAGTFALVVTGMVMKKVNYFSAD
jgi:hypothetical protein